MKKDIILFLVISAITISSAFIVNQRAGADKDPKGFWAIINSDCIGCGGCATECVIPSSAAKAEIDQLSCIGLKDCPAFYKTTKGDFSRGRENQNCPTGALSRTEVGDGKYKYTVNKEKCIGCGRCTRACQRKGDGALTLVIDPDYCLECNECSIVAECPKDAVVRTDLRKGKKK